MSCKHKFRISSKNADGKTFVEYFTLEDLILIDSCKSTTEIISKDQYTCMNDDNGKEVYENDMVECVLQDEDGNFHETIGTVIYNEFEYCVDTDIHDWPVASWKTITKVKVLGNRIENPELYI